MPAALSSILSCELLNYKEVVFVLPAQAITVAAKQPLWDVSPATSVRSATYGIDLLSEGKILCFSINVPNHCGSSKHLLLQKLICPTHHTVTGNSRDIGVVELPPNHTVISGEGTLSLLSIINHVLNIASEPFETPQQCLS